MISLAMSVALMQVHVEAPLRPRLELVWKGAAGRFMLVKSAGNQLYSVPRYPDQSGSLRPPGLPPPLAPDVADRLKEAVTGRHVVMLHGQPVHVLWDSDRVKLGVDEYGEHLLSFTPNSLKLQKRIRLPGPWPCFLGGNPDGGAFTVWTGTEEHGNYDWLVLPGLRLSKLPVAHVVDWFKSSSWIEVGIGIRPDRSFYAPQVAGIAPSQPFICGDPMSGHVYWKSTKYDQAVIAANGKFVLAHTIGGGWDILATRTGKIVRHAVSELSRARDQGDLLAVGNDVFLQTTQDNHTVTYRYQFR